MNGVAIDGGALFLIVLLVLALAVTLIVRLGALMREHIGDPIFARAIRAPSPRVCLPGAAPSWIPRCARCNPKAS